MALDFDPNQSINPNAYSFEASVETFTGKQVQATQTFGAVALDPKLQQQLNQVLRPEEHGQRAIQVDPQLADDIERVGADVHMSQGSPGILGDIVGAAKSLGSDMANAKASLTANQPAPVVASAPLEPEIPTNVYNQSLTV